LATGQLATALTAAVIIISIVNIFAPKTEVDSLLAKDLTVVTVLFVVTPFIIIRRNKAMAKFVLKKYLQTEMFRKIERAFKNAGSFLMNLKRNRIYDISDNQNGTA
jgi:hypothetical protein